jgi:hypothetical protein
MYDPMQRAKHIALGEDRAQQILDCMEQNAEQDTPVTRGEIMDYCMSQFKIKSTRGLGNSFFVRDSDGVIQTESGAQEWQRSQVPGCFSRE